jgi:hypothetical protein
MQAKRKTPVWVVYDVYGEEVIGVFSHKTYADRYTVGNEVENEFYPHFQTTKHYIDELNDK